jgi:outer membrane receptor protein involved in Fe transport
VVELGTACENAETTPVELTCADPEDPCRLPNAFVSDPPLEQVVARTFEAGARGSHRGVNWALAGFNTAVRDDIIFVSSGTRRGEGHFQNVDRTDRKGVEASVDYGTARVSAFAAYTLQRATYGRALTVTSPHHPLASAGELAVAEGDRLPGVPAHVAKAGFAARAFNRLDAGATMRAQSGQTLRGDEANLLADVPGFLVLNAHAQYRIWKRVSVVGEVQNLLDSDHYTFGGLGDASLVDPQDGDPRFFSPAAPRAAWAGLRVTF